MPKRLHNFIVLLLVLVLPTQGFAAAGMLACSSGHARMMAPVTVDEMPVETVHAPRHDHGLHHHAGKVAHDSPVSGADADVIGPLADVDGFAGARDVPAGAKCSACAACCIGAAPAPDKVLPATPEFSPTPLLAVSTIRVSFVTDGPIRPPRSVLA